jgi:hypothetical protein
VVLLISYDLKSPSADYKPLYEAIKSYGYWWHHLESTWIIDTPQTPEQVFNHLRPHIKSNDKLFIMRIQGNGWASGIAQSGFDWLKDRAY